MSEKAVIDRFEGDWAVLQVGEDARAMIVPRGYLPKEAREGAVLKVRLEDGQLVEAELDPEETERVKARIAEKLARLRSGEHRKKRLR